MVPGEVLLLIAVSAIAGVIMSCHCCLKIARECVGREEKKWIWTPFIRAKEDWQLKQVPEFVGFLDKVFPERQATTEGGQKKTEGCIGRIRQKVSDAWRGWRNKKAKERRRQKTATWRIEKVERPRPWWTASWKRSPIFDKEAMIKLLRRFEEKLIRAVGADQSATFWDDISKMRAEPENLFRHNLFDPFKTSLETEINIANQAAKQFFDESQKQNRKIARKWNKFATALNPLSPMGTRVDEAAEWTNLQLRADPPNLESSEEAFEHVQEVCKEAIKSMEKKPKRDWTIGVGTYWFIVFQLIRQSGLPEAQSLRLFSDTATKSCTLSLHEVEEARRRAHINLAESRGWPLVREVSYTFLKIMWDFDRPEDLIYFPLGWSVRRRDLSNAHWIGWLFTQAVTALFPKFSGPAMLKHQAFAQASSMPVYGWIDRPGRPRTSLRLDPPPTNFAIEQISDLLWMVNFLSFADEFTELLREFILRINPAAGAESAATAATTTATAATTVPDVPKLYFLEEIADAVLPHES